MNPTRRDVLRGTGALLALPFLESLSFGAAPARPPLRMGIVTVTGGTVLESWKPKEAGALGKLPSILRCLEPVKDELLVVSGLSHNGKTDGLNGHESAGYLHLTGAPVAGKVQGKSHAGKSVDQAAAEVVGQSSYLPSLEIGMSNQETRYSWRSADQHVPYESNPRLVFDRMFRGRKVAVPDWSRRSDAPAASAGAKRDSDDQSVIDLVLDEAKRLKTQLGSADKLRLDEYLHSVRTVERRVQLVEGLQRQAALDAEHPGPSSAVVPANLPDGKMAGKMRQATERDPEIHAEFTRLMADLMVLAFQADVTRVITFVLANEGSNKAYPTIGVSEGHHDLSHHGNDAKKKAKIAQINTFHVRQLAYLLEKLKATKEGAGNLLDHCMIAYGSGNSDGNAHNHDDLPILVAGGGAGTLRGGRHVRYAKDTPLNNLWLSLLERVGVTV
ncbi:MAG: DUF1552 domain-containing protein, partial [Planctomycetaceae bacterium]|nr:DUF1552 domain-containing protein [Planctomycetaceae bacterium]